MAANIITYENIREIDLIQQNRNIQNVTLVSYQWISREGNSNVPPDIILY